MLTDLKNLAYICSVETARVNLRAQLRDSKPFWGVLAVDDPKGFFYGLLLSKARNLDLLSVPRQGSYDLSGVILRAMRRRDIKTFSDAVSPTVGEGAEIKQSKAKRRLNRNDRKAYITSNFLSMGVRGGSLNPYLTLEIIPLLQ